VIALYYLAPDGKELAEQWLEKTAESWPGNGREFLLDLQGRAMVLGALGRTSFESDWLTRRQLERLDFGLAHAAPLEAEPLETFESWFEEIGRFGVAARLAIPRLKELSKGQSPIVRMWAVEALERIAPPASKPQ
jgi:hypothetical protein